MTIALVFCSDNELTNVSKYNEKKYLENLHGMPTLRSLTLNNNLYP